VKTAAARQARLEISIAAVLAGIFLLFIIGNPKVFTRFDIYYSFMSTIPFFGIMALAMTLVVTLGEMDLSFPSVLALSALLFGKVFTFTGSIWLAALVCFIVGITAGAINALLIVRVGIPSLVATIGTMFFFRGMVNVIAQGKGIALVKAKETLFYSLAVGRIGGVFPAQAAWMLLLGVGFWVLLNRHRFGSHVLFVGDNMESSRMMGINVERVNGIFCRLCRDIIHPRGDIFLAKSGTRVSADDPGGCFYRGNLCVWRHGNYFRNLCRRYHYRVP
jgi:simple sugar transport system permease protein